MHSHVRSFTSLAFVLVVFLALPYETQALYKYGSNVQTVVYSYQQQYQSCWSAFLGWFCTWRWRTLYAEYYQCYSGWHSNDNYHCSYAICNGLTNLNGACNNYFSNSHIIYDRTSVQYYAAGSCNSPGSCSCTKNGFYSLGHTCGMCDAMSNCDTEVCTSQHNEYCSRCAGRVSDQQGYRAYRKTNGICYQACSWRSDSTRCYPGTCNSEYSNSCSCTSGYSGSHCQNIDNNPTIHNNKLQLIKSNSDTITAPANINGGGGQGTVWTNYNDPQNVYYRFQTSYSVSAPSYHNYITNFRVGISGARFYITQTRSSSNIRSYTHTCPGGLSSSNPYTSLLTCDATLSASSQLSLPMAHRDVITFTFQSDNSGFVNVYNHETTATATHYYSGRTQSNAFTYTIDIVNPYHCTSGTTCLNQMLDVPDVATSNPVTMTWSNWVDDDSGIAGYSMQVWKLVASSSQLVKSSQLTSSSFGSGSSSHSFNVASAGMYSIIHTCTDVATNYKKTRRLFLYDPTSTITTHSGIIRVETAAPNTSYVWQHTLTPITVDWTDRYWNSFHHNNELLKYVVDESEVVSSYDDYESTRPRTAITNVWGIVQFTTTFSVDHQGGATLSLPGTGSFVTESDLDQTRTFHPGAVDGDTVRFWVRSYDLRDYAYSYVESITVHIDTSDPIIENLWLTSPGTNDYTQLYVHNDLDLQSITIEWDAYDYHSGIDTIFWRLYDNFTNSDYDHGYAQPSSQTTSTLSQCNSAYSSAPRGAVCYCTGPVGCYHSHFVINPSLVSRGAGIGGVFSDANTGVHDYDYWIEVTVTNHANLITVLTAQITIDNSPPEGGHVYDSQTGTDDEDYRSSLQIYAHWDGFFDKESGIRFYQYGFSTSCLSASYFDKHNPSGGIYTTTNTYASYSAGSWTKYYVTVVAFNEALGESEPVCSDGITLDQNNPSVSNIYVEGVSVPPGLVTYNNIVYLIEQDRMKVTVTGPDSSCRSKARSISSSQLAIFPTRSHDGGATGLDIDSAIGCSYNTFDSDFLTRFYLINDGHIYMNWTSSDSTSPLYDQYVAIGTSSSNTVRNILDWTSTNNHNTFHYYHPSLSEGQNFYIHVKARDVTNREYIKTIGPGILNKQTSPSYPYGIGFIVTSNTFKAYWTTSYFSDYEKYHLKYKVAIEDVSKNEIVYPFHFPMSGPSCTVSTTSSPSCASVPFSSLLTDVHEGHVYRAIIQVTNLANKTYTRETNTYTYKIEYAETGVVYEVVPDSEQDTLRIRDSEDTNYQLSRNTLKVRWFGFETRWHDVTYLLALGTSPTDMNVAVNRWWTSGVYEYTFTGLNLNVDTVYYCRIRAYASQNYIDKASDGVRITQASRTLSSITINDGDDCYHQYNDKPAGFSAQHQYEELSVSCPSDLTYQPMTNMYTAKWSVSSTQKLQTPDIRWNMEMYNTTTSTWEQSRQWVSISSQQLVTATGLSLIPGEKYRAGVEFCVGTACSNTRYSDGVTITPNPPASGEMSSDYSVSGNTGTLVIEFEKFKDPDISDLSQSQSAIAGYQYALTDNTHDSALLKDWRNAAAAINSINSTFNRLTLTFNPAIDFSVCRTFSLKGYNYVGMSATRSIQIQNCTAYDPLLIVPNVVIDAVGSLAGELDYVGDSVVLDMNAEWPTPDADYTPYTNILSAVWPKLRHRNYTYAVVRLTGSWDSTHFEGTNHLSLSDPCNHINAIYCGETTLEYANIYFSSGSLLTNGRRYAVCVHAEATQIVHEKWVEDLPEVGECSDGITIDTQAPTGGRVLIANLRNSLYLPYTNEVTVQWDQFSDVESLSYASHDSGIMKYQLALGSIEFGEDVLKFHDIGLINQITLDNLNLVEGSMYYASIKAFDFTGKYTTETSSGFIVDNSPPIITNVQFNFPSKYLTSLSAINVCWDGVFVDPESSISSYKWAVGTQPGHMDRMDFVTETTTCGTENMDNTLMDGKAYYITLMAYNGADLYNVTYSKPMMVAVNGPTAGVVFDGPSSGRTTTTQDDDYKTSVGTPLEAYWRWFYSPFATLSYYTVSLGSCDGCDDLARDVKVGLRTEIIWTDMQLSPGSSYFTTVTACDSTDRCTTATSDGILIDTTSPVAGVVQDGTFDEDVEFQNLRTFIGAKWYGFHDPESGIVNYQWSAGTSPGSTDVKTWVDVGFIEIVYDASFSTLSVGTKIYVNIRAYNRAGLHTTASSNGFIVDTSSPGANHVPRLLEGIGSLDGSTLIARDAFRVEWSFTDSESSIEKYYISITSHVENGYSHSAVELPAIVTQHTFNYQDILSMQDGSDYYVKVKACNMAKLCTTSTSSSILFDSTPPLPGMFAVGTIHAARLTRHQSSWMTYTTNSVKLAWVGFRDMHSGIDHYLVSIGTTPFATDLNSGNTYASVSHTNSGTQYGDEGYVQLKTITTNSLSGQSSIFVGIWAVNGVDLKSQALHHELYLTAGNLDLRRRCSAYNCQGHCVCAIQDQTCSAASGCSDITSGGPTHDIVTVQDVSDLSFSSGSDSHSPSLTYLAAQWSITTTQGLSVERYEVSVGTASSSSPTGIYTGGERNWYDVGQMTTAVIPLHDRQLTADTTNSVFIRAWYSSSQYAIFKSPGVTNAPHAITTTDSTGIKVKDLQQSADTKDTDFIASSSTVHVRWDGLFQAGTSGIDKFKVYISRIPGGHDIASSGFINYPTTSYSFTGLSLLEDTRYYSNVLVYNHAGIVSWDSSDGFIVDLTAPSNGLVLDGSELRDIDAQQGTSVLHAQWEYFSDTGSGIQKYYWCISTLSDTSNCNIRGWTDMQLKTNGEASQGVSPGTTIYHKVKAEDWAGNMSPVSVSDGVVIDTSGPQAVNTIYFSESELLSNPSFEVDTYVFDNTTTCDVSDPNSWSLSSGGCTKLLSSNSPVAFHQSQYILMSGELSQTASVVSSNLYRLKLKVAYAQTLEPHHKSMDGYVNLGLDSHSFHLDPDRCQGQCEIETENSILWYTFSFYHTAVSSSLTVTLGTRHHTSDMRLAVDDVSLIRVYYNQQYGGQPSENYISHHALFLPLWSTINAQWHFSDSQSPIVDYSWAIGTVPGGTQLQGFTSVGTLNHGIKSDLNLNHNSTVHITIVARNQAGVITKAEFDPIVVDLTPPVITDLHDGTGNDLDYQTSYTISANWQFEDNETDTDYCVWAIGSKPGGYDIKIFEKLGNQVSTASYAVNSASYPAPYVFYTTIRCYNTLGLFSVAYTNGVTVVDENRQDGIENMEILKDSHTYWSVSEQCVTTPDSFRLKWDVQQTDTLIQYYKFTILDVTADPPTIEVRNCTENVSLVNGTNNSTGLNVSNANITNANNDNSTNNVTISAPCNVTVYIYSNESVWDRNSTELLSLIQDYAPFSATLHQLAMNNSRNISVSITPVDIFGTDREGTDHLVMINPPGPEIQGMMTTETNLTQSTNLTLDWSDVFSSFWSNLTYEISVGSKQGASDIIQWQHTFDTTMMLDLSNAHFDTFNLSVIITAYDACGYYNTYNTGVFQVYLPGG